MRSHRPLIGLTLGVLICAGSAGCAVNSTIAVRGPGRRTDNAPPQRLLAIAKVFEQQGHLDRAASMYERVLVQNPSSIQARTAIARIESMNQPRDFRGHQPAESEIQGETLLAETNDLDAGSVRTDEATLVPESTVVIQPQIPIAFPGVVTLSPVPPEPKLEVASSVVSTAVGISTQGVSSVESIPEVTAPENQLISLAEVKAASAAQVMTDLASETESNVDVLLRVLNESHDLERRAVAASLLADVPADDSRVDTALEQHCLNDTPLVSSVACESLLTRGLVSEPVIQMLLKLSEDPDAVVRSQVTGTLRRLEGTPWSDDAVQASLMRLDDTSSTVRGLAALTLSEFPGLKECLYRSRSSTVREAETPDQLKRIRFVCRSQTI